MRRLIIWGIEYADAGALVLMEPICPCRDLQKLSSKIMQERQILTEDYLAARARRSLSTEACALPADDKTRGQK